MKKFLRIFFISFLSVCMCGCGSENEKKIAISKDVESYNDLNELTENAPYIVSGKFVRLERSWNMQRDVTNPVVESQIRYHEGHIYQFEVGEVLKGNIDKKVISVNQGYLERVYLTSDGDLETDSSKIDKSQYVDYIETSYIEPDFNKNYVIAMNYDSMFDLFYPSAINALYEGNEDSLVIPKKESNSKQTFKKGNKSIVVESKYNIDDEMLSKISLSELRKQIQKTSK